MFFVRRRRVFLTNAMNTILQILATVTDTKADDWELLDGPESGFGIDYWFQHRKTGTEAYASLDQDNVNLSVNGQQLYDGPHSEPL